MYCLRSLGSRDRGFESHSWNECVVFVCVCVFLCLYTGLRFILPCSFCVVNETLIRTVKVKKLKKGKVVPVLN
jgi:hypothetical protein